MVVFFQDINLQRAYKYLLDCNLQQSSFVEKNQVHFSILAFLETCLLTLCPIFGSFCIHVSVKQQ